MGVFLWRAIFPPQVTLKGGLAANAMAAYFLQECENIRLAEGFGKGLASGVRFWVRSPY